MEKSVVFIELRIDAYAERIDESCVAVALPHLSRTAEKDCRRKARKSANDTERYGSRRSCSPAYFGRRLKYAS